MDLNFGHMIIEKNGIKCTCGNNGCFEAYGSMKSLKTKMALVENLKSITGKQLYQIIQKDKKESRKVIDEYLENLCIGFTNYINIFEPEAICIGGSFVYYKDLLLNDLINKMNKKNRTFNGEIPKIITAKMKNDAGIIGATIF